MGGQSCQVPGERGTKRCEFDKYRESPGKPSADITVNYRHASVTRDFRWIVGDRRSLGQGKAVWTTGPRVTYGGGCQAGGSRVAVAADSTIPGQPVPAEKHEVVRDHI
ncbi:hypothetical protein GCM10009677_19350 [Sphaerisporangium rubeum]